MMGDRKSSLNQQLSEGVQVENADVPWRLEPAPRLAEQGMTSAGDIGCLDPEPAARLEYPVDCCNEVRGVVYVFDDVIARHDIKLIPHRGVHLD
jgi:hypothetical protein